MPSSDAQRGREGSPRLQVRRPGCEAAPREAAGEVVAFMAHDDLWLPDHLELLSACLERSGAEIVYGRPTWVIPRGLVAPLTFNLHQPETLERFVAREQNSIPAGSVVHRRECLDKYGYWNAELPRHGDLDTWARIVEWGGRKNFAYLPETTCLHFRANWRKENEVGQPQLEVWKALHSLDGLVPAELKVEVPPEKTEQEAFWLALEADPPGWTASLRTAIQRVLDRHTSLSDQLTLSLLRAGGDRRD